MLHLNFRAERNILSGFHQDFFGVLLKKCPRKAKLDFNDLKSL